MAEMIGDPDYSKLVWSDAFGWLPRDAPPTEAAPAAVTGPVAWTSQINLDALKNGYDCIVIPKAEGPFSIALYVHPIALAGEAGWRTDEPPKDHFPILAWAIEYGRVVAFQDATWAWWPCPATKPLPCPPTHWKPLDASPNALPTPPGAKP